MGPIINQKILFITLTTFSRTGGVEKFNKCFLKALLDFNSEYNLESFSTSLYDDSVDKKYYTKDRFKGFSGNRISFVLQSIFSAKKFDHIIIGHINLAMVGYGIKLLFPQKKVSLITHGYEVWTPLSGLKKKLVNKADLIFAVSNFTKEKLINKQKLNSNKIALFSNTIDPYFKIPDAFEVNSSLRKRYNLTESDFVLFTLTRLSAIEGYKGYDIVIKCMPALLKSIPNLKYVIAGKYDALEKSRLDNLIGELQLEDKVIFTGYLKNEEVEAHYQVGDLFIMPSMGEGFGIVFIEAMVCGMPVIGGNQDGSVDALKEGELGTLVNPLDEEDITNTIMALYKRRDECTVEWKSDLQRKTMQTFGFPQYKKNLLSILSSSN